MSTTVEEVKEITNRTSKVTLNGSNVGHVTRKTVGYTAHKAGSLNQIQRRYPTQAAAIDALKKE